MKNKRVLISGGGIAGLTLGILLQQKGWEPLIIERDPDLRTDGYIVDVFGTGYDVAERIGIIEALKEVRYPLERLEYVDRSGKPFLSVPMSRIKKSFGNKYLPLRRSDLERVLFERAKTVGLGVRFGSEVRSLKDTGTSVDVEFADNSHESFSMVFGADGVHSKIRQLVFGEEGQFARFLGTWVAAFHTANKYGFKDSINLFEEKDHLVAVYPISKSLIATIYLFRHHNTGYVPRERRLDLIKDKFKAAGWVCRQILDDVQSSTPIFLDSFTQIVMHTWSRGRVALLGDACSCLTMISGQGSQLAMGQAYVIARELERNQGDFSQAFHSYEKFLKPLVRRKQDDAARFLKIVIPSANSPAWPRRAAVKLVFSSPFINFLPLYFGSKSVLRNF